MASASGDGTIGVWDPATGREHRRLDDHHDWRAVFTLAEPQIDDGPNPESTVMFHPSLPVLATLGGLDTTVRLWSVDIDSLLGSPPQRPEVAYRSAKVVLVGPSAVGKSCLARALLGLPLEPQESTHGMKVWSMLDETVFDAPASPYSRSSSCGISRDRRTISWSISSFWTRRRSLWCRSIPRSLVKASPWWRTGSRPSGGRPETAARVCSSQGALTGEDTVLSHLQTQGLVWRLSFGDLVVLQPELLNDYASSVVLAARNHPHGLGCVVERDVIEARIDLTGAPRIAPAEAERLLLHAVVERLLERDIALREGVHLVFPSKLSVPKPSSAEDLPADTIYHFKGSAEEITVTGWRSASRM